MSFSDWQSGPSSSSQEERYGFVCMSTTVDDLSYTPSEQEKSRDAAQIVATGRRSWKTLKGKGEAVWPPLLEAALIEALEKYQPEAVGSKSNKTLGRFPMRNRFISDYIFEITGKRRTPKQVGSRLQQLRDTCKGDKILQLISHRNTPEPTSASSQSEYSHGASPSPPPGGRTSSVSSTTRTLPSRPVTVYVQISLQPDLWPTPAPSIHFVNNSANSPQIIQLCPSTGITDASFLQGRPSGTSVEFPSSTALSPQSTFVVYADGSNTPIHTEVVPLTCISSPMQRSGWLYGSELVPSFWPRLCMIQDPSKYTILQRLRPVDSRHPSNYSPMDGMDDRYISIVYKFASPPLRPTQRQPGLLPSGYQSGYSKRAPTSRPVPAPRASMPNIPLDQWQSAVFDDQLPKSWSPPSVSSHHSNEYSYELVPTSQTHAFSEPRAIQFSRHWNGKGEGGMCSNEFSPTSYTSMTGATPNLWSTEPPLYSQNFAYSYSEVI